MPVVLIATGLQPQMHIDDEGRGDEEAERTILKIFSPYHPRHHTTAPNSLPQQ